MTNITPGDPNSAREYEVGYKKPPKDSQFKPGCSGNLGGGRKERPELSDLLLGILDQKVEGFVDGKRCRMSRLKLALTNLANKAATGDARACRELFACMERFGIDLTTRSGGLTFIIEE